MKKLLPMLMAGLIAISGITALNYRSASAAGHKADVDMVAACKRQFEAAYSHVVKIVEWNVMGWKCYINNKDYAHDIDVKGWCKAKYGGTAKYDDFNNPYSWYCEY